MLFRKHKGLSVILALVLLVGAVIGTAGVVKATDRADALFDRLRLVYDVVEVWHKDGADVDAFVNGAIKGGLEALGDPYTNYFPPDDYQAFMESLEGSFGGIGAYLEQEDQYVIISAPIKGSPAFRAGLASGDRILEVNGVSLIGGTPETAAKSIKGEPGTKVTLKLYRPSNRTTFTVTITREQIQVPEVEYKMLEPGIGYIQIASFGDDASETFFKGVAQLKAKGAKSLVIDLRMNGGGYLDAAVEIASGFVPAGKPVVWEIGKESKTALNSRGANSVGLPAVVLVDDGTASASEILAGALQDYGLAPLVGTTTFGKGTVQQLLNFTDGAGMKVTIAEYLTPNERHVHKIGLKPDYEVERTQADPERTEPMTFTRFLGLSSVGLDVLHLQYRLQDLGYDPDTNGFFGLRTERAVERFMLDNWLRQDPVVDAKFLEVLNQKVSENTRKAAEKDLQLDKALELAREKLK